MNIFDLIALKENDIGCESHEIGLLVMCDIQEKNYMEIKIRKKNIEDVIKMRK